MNNDTQQAEQKGIIMRAKESASAGVTHLEPEANEFVVSHVDPLANNAKIPDSATADSAPNEVKRIPHTPFGTFPLGVLPFGFGMTFTPSHIAKLIAGGEGAVDSKTEQEASIAMEVVAETAFEKSIASDQVLEGVAAPSVIIPEAKSLKHKAQESTAQETMAHELSASVLEQQSKVEPQEAEPAKTTHSLKKTKAAKKASLSKPLACVINHQWQSMHEQVAGRSHRNALQPMPCQDVAFSAIQPRPILLLADGAGSAAVSEQGAQALVSGISRLLNTLEQQVASLLDQPTSTAAEARQFCLLLIKHGIGLLTDKASEQRRAVKDFNATFLVAILGKENWLWLRVGDGGLVMETMTVEQNAEATAGAKMQLSPTLTVLGSSGKGEFANQTTFVNAHLQPEQVQSGFMPIAGLTGLALMSDGAAERLVAYDGSRASSQLSQWFHSLRAGKLKRHTLVQRLVAEEFVTGMSGDDCSLALLATEFVME
ncbi:hypothetical protein CBP31_13005 [Oceanisphaera profunda]|uniref:PPM-type phosphatase domain-containing protein n=1 Tax=Oceanisphaera profunda TaxID=1416627 RepID=A0A1Y0D8R9_9GAMM|nr:protein phosphatase 2C domain-containing protein [Oceanisphaera profunda]ART83425.1 hypothetical protein CBP31_13005 [Oceanisphaera profunda]